MTAEDIVRALAADNPPIDYLDGGESRCALCGANADVAPHAADCEWRLAREWVAEHGGVSVGSPPDGDVERPG